MFGYESQKRIFDILFSAFLIVCALPIMLVIATIVFIDLRSVFFVQERVGQHGELFNIWKFRTMRKASRAEEHEVDYHNKRTTQVGAFLRKTKLDELPQLFQVFWGKMSIVGPRPELPDYVNFHGKFKEVILSVRPGLVDDASLEYINEAELLSTKLNPKHYYINEIMSKKSQLSAARIDKNNFWLDLRIVLRTWKVLFYRFFKS